MSSSDSNARWDLRWAEHYRVASRRRRARGWHRREDHARSASRVSRRLRLSIVAAVAFVALTIVALVVAR